MALSESSGSRRSEMATWRKRRNRHHGSWPLGGIRKVWQPAKEMAAAISISKRISKRKSGGGGSSSGHRKYLAAWHMAVWRNSVAVA